MGKAQAQSGRARARDARLQAARERRLKLDPEQMARERRIDQASVDVQVAWEKRARAEQAVTDANLAAAVDIERLVAECLAVKDVVHLTRARSGDRSAASSRGIPRRGRDRARQERRSGHGQEDLAALFS